MSNFDDIRQIATAIELAIRWSDQDINGHVNNARILTLMEEARVRAFQQWTSTTPDGKGYRRVVRALNTTFDREVHYGQDTTVWVWIPKIGKTSYVVGHLMVQDGQPCAYTEVTIVVIDSDTGRPKPHEAKYRAELERRSGPAYDPSNT
ncbi:MAG TPA: thioesterase family protein [Enteractinococcus sp.]